MAESIFIESNLTDEEKYVELRKQIKSLLNREDHLLSSLANCTAALKQTFGKISWVGFYLLEGDYLYLGPFQGKVACAEIQVGKGVCGTAAERKETIIVPDVNKFPGHIACDAESRSEIVVPVIKDDKIFGVLDLDSNSYKAFNETDKKYLEELVSFLSKEVLQNIKD
ncbi:MAG: GAF domain-containing protein [Ignavibacteria bacterium]